MISLMCFLCKIGITAAFIQTNSNYNCSVAFQRLIISLIHSKVLPCDMLLAYSDFSGSQEELMVCGGFFTDLRPLYILNDVNSSLAYGAISYKTPCVIIMVILGDDMRTANEFVPLLTHPSVDLSRDHMVFVSFQNEPALNVFEGSELRTRLK